MEKVFRQQVVQQVKGDSRTKLSEKTLLGYAFSVIRDTVIAKGFADFTTGHENLSDREKVLLYCFINMKGCFYATCTTFRINEVKLKRLFDENAKTVMVDIGGGPGTAFFALNEAFPCRRIAYQHVDTSSAMRMKAKELFTAGVADGLVNPLSTIELWDSWSGAGIPNCGGPLNVLLNFSYFFASRSLNTDGIATLVHFVKRLASNQNIELLTISFTDSPVDSSWEKYFEFKAQLGLPQHEARSPKHTTQFYKKRSNATFVRQEFIGEVVEVKRREDRRMKTT